MLQDIFCHVNGRTICFCYISTYYASIPDHFSTGHMVLQGMGNGFINLMKVDCGLPLTNLQSYVLRPTSPSPSTKPISGVSLFIFKTGVYFSMSSESVTSIRVDKIFHCLIAHEYRNHKATENSCKRIMQVIQLDISLKSVWMTYM